ncbi:MAG: alpha-amylase family glycosyl hydrolase [Salinivirgaceae bacterium]
MKAFSYIFLIWLSALLLGSCASPAPKASTEQNVAKSSKVYTHADWVKNATIYEVNVRQYTKEGTFAAFEKEMPRLKEMGVDILWIMPIHPIGEINRKGSLGSYYAVKDYQKVNPEYGTIDDFKQLVDAAHELGMYVIIDWVANHTSWDNWLIQSHPNWYTRDSLGIIVAPVADWTDVADLNYDVPELREYMTQSLEFWVNEANIDGYRCDVAGMVPIDFWSSVRIRLDSIKPVFMLAEWESNEAMCAFDMVYGWDFHHIMNQIAQGKKEVSALDAYFAKIDSLYDADDYYMYFTSNHDENSWSGTEFERMGSAAQTMAVLAATVPGMPLIYSGQEAKLEKRLSFFEKDIIDWKNYEYQDFYKKLLTLKHDHKALWNGNSGGSFERIATSDSSIYSFSRSKDEDQVVVILNLSANEKNVSLQNEKIKGNYTSLFTQENIALSSDRIFKLEPWGYLVLTKNN